MVFEGLIKKGELGGFGLENIGNVSDLNGTVKLAESFTPKEFLPPEQQQRELVDEEEFEDEDEEFEDERLPQQQPPPPQPNFFGEGDTPQQRQGGFFEDNPNEPTFFESVVPKQKTKAKATGGIPNVANFFGDNLKPKANKPLIGNLKEGVPAFDSSFGNQGGLKKGTGFDNFVGTLDISRLSRGLPDSAVPQIGIFAKKDRGLIGRNFAKPVDLSQQSVNVLPSPRGFEDISDAGFDSTGEAEQFDPFEEPKKRKAGRPKGSVGKKKRQARKLAKTGKKTTTKKTKKKKKKEVDKARFSLLREKNRLEGGGAPRNALQSSSFSRNDNSFRGVLS